MLSKATHHSGARLQTYLHNHCCKYLVTVAGRRCRNCCYRNSLIWLHCSYLLSDVGCLYSLLIAACLYMMLFLESHLHYRYTRYSKIAIFATVPMGSMKSSKLTILPPFRSKMPNKMSMMTIRTKKHLITQKKSSYRRFRG